MSGSFNLEAHTLGWISHLPISDFLKEHYPSYRQPTIRKLYAAARSLKKYPYRGRIGQKEGTRQLVIGPMPCIIVYAVGSDMVHILRVIHTSQEWPVEGKARL